VACKDWGAISAPEKRLLLKDNVRASKHASETAGKIAVYGEIAPPAEQGRPPLPCCGGVKTAKSERAATRPHRGPRASVRFTALAEMIGPNATE
jgi:hypothetical protein